MQVYNGENDDVLPSKEADQVGEGNTFFHIIIN